MTLPEDISTKCDLLDLQVESMERIYVRTPKKQSLCNPPFFTRSTGQYSNRNYYYFKKTKASSYVKKYIRCDVCLQALGHHWRILFKIIKNDGVKQTLTFLTDKGFFSWFQIFAVFWMLYAFFWVIPQHLNFICRHFGTLCLFHLNRRVGMKNSSYLSAYEDGTDGVFQNVSI